MIINKRPTLNAFWLFGKKNILTTIALSTIVVVSYKLLHFHIIAIPFLPVATIGTAVSFYVGFKNNQSYERLWEARKLWGSITNLSRILAASFMSIVGDKTQQRAFLFRHIVYVNVLRLQLRKTIHWATNKEDYHKQLASDLDEIIEFDHAVQILFEQFGKIETFEAIKDKANIANHTLKMQFDVLIQLKRNEVLDAYEHSDLSKLLGELYNLQGNCERIKTTPLFRQFSIFSRVFVQLFIFLLPFALIGEMDKIGDYGIWLTVPFSVLISWVFMSMEQIGETSENPFDNGISDTPMSAICRNIEIDILELLHETNIPSRIKPFKNVLH
jgi:ion channel-forming bestrophin family protein